MILIAESNFWTIASTIATIAYTGLTLWLVWETIKTRRSAQDPCVVVHATVDESRPTFILLIIENVGKSVARDIRFAADGPIPRRAFGLTKDAAIVEPYSEGPLMDGIAALGPGDKRKILWGQLAALKKNVPNGVIHVTVSFKADNRDCKPVMCALDINSFISSDAVDPDGARQCADHLKRLVEIVDQAGRGFRQLHVQLVKRNDPD